MTSVQQKQTTSIHQIQHIHQQQLKSGIKNDEYEHEIVQILGGIDEILTVWFQSNSNPLITHKHIASIHNIFTKSHKQQPQRTKLLLDSNNVEDKWLNKNIIYTFNDQDTILFSSFNYHNASKILKVMQSKTIIAVLSMILLILMILAVVSTNYGLSWDVVYVYGSLMYLIYVIYIIFWLLYINKVAMKLIMTQFELYFKMFYLIQYIIANIGMIYLQIHTDPWYAEYAQYLLLTAFLFWVMVFDAVNIKQGNKLIISCIAAGLFSWNALEHLRISYFRDKYTEYAKGTIKISNILGLDDIELSLFDISYNAAMILSIFLFKQILLSMINPNRCLLIRKNPIIKYENIHMSNTISEITEKHNKKWRVFCILYMFFFCFVCIYSIVISSAQILHAYYILLALCTFIIICCLFINRIKFLYFSICVIFICIIIIAGGIFFLHVSLWAGEITVPLLGFGFIANYVLKVIELRKLESETSNVEILNNIGEQMDLEMVVTKQIEIQRIEQMKVMKQKRECSESISFENTETTELNIVKSN